MDRLTALLTAKPAVRWSVIAVVGLGAVAALLYVVL